MVERLLTMPLASYRKRPTGELLANADVDVTTSSNVLMPLPFSLGVVALIAISHLVPGGRFPRPRGDGPCA